jgi:beta-lactamase class A
MASTVKVPVALELYAQVADGSIDPTMPVTLTAADRTLGPRGLSQFEDPVTASVRDLAYLMMSVSDNAATDVITDMVGIDAVNARLRSIGCAQTVVVSTVRELIDDVGRDLGFADYRELPLLRAIWADTAAPADACASTRAVMSKQVTRRLGAAVPDGGTLAAKSGGLFGRVRNEIGVIGFPDGDRYAVAVFTSAPVPFTGGTAIEAAMAAAVGIAIDAIRDG